MHSLDSVTAVKLSLTTFAQKKGRFWQIKYTYNFCRLTRKHIERLLVMTSEETSWPWFREANTLTNYSRPLLRGDGRILYERVGSTSDSSPFQSFTLNSSSSIAKSLTKIVLFSSTLMNRNKALSGTAFPPFS